MFLILRGRWKRCFLNAWVSLTEKRCFLNAWVILTGKHVSDITWAVETRFLNIYFNQNVDNYVCDRAVSCFTTEINSVTSFYI